MMKWNKNLHKSLRRQINQNNYIDSSLVTYRSLLMIH